MILRILVIISFLCCYGYCAYCQKDDASPNAPGQVAGPETNDSLTYKSVRNVTITGYKRAKLYIVEREVAIKPGDLYTKAKLFRAMRQTREQLMNTALF